MNELYRKNKRIGNIKKHNNKENKSFHVSTRYMNIKWKEKQFVRPKRPRMHHNKRGDGNEVRPSKRERLKGATPEERKGSKSGPKWCRNSQRLTCMPTPDHPVSPNR